ncbi:MAG: FAD-dependent oxidoreductase, partial [Clostridia bacterium]|nr:FAD-dependent oxidoreductase [Clostridia bacterium]
MKYLILGAGPAGLTLANMLKQAGEDSFLVIEKESVAGGLCRSVDVDGTPFDIGGGHFLDVRRPDVNEFLFKFMPEDEWNIFDRDSRISVCGQMIHHPMEANIWEMDLMQQVDYLKSIAVAGCNTGKEMPEHFIDWINWKLGDRIAADYMIPYNKKMFADELNELGTYWLEKLPNVSFEDTLLSCLTKKAYGKQPGHARFYYPKKYGYGELWLRMAEAIKDNIVYNSAVSKMDCANRTVQTEDGANYSADYIITTIPWNSFRELIGMPDNIRESKEQLKHSAVETRYFDKNLDTEAQWIYYPDEQLPYHRILVRHNFCTGSRGYWTETRKERVDMFNEEDKKRFSYLNEYAYPLNTVSKPAAIKNLLDWSKKHNIIGLGRWGEHQHYNSDVVVALAMEL